MTVTVQWHSDTSTYLKGFIHLYTALDTLYLLSYWSSSLLFEKLRISYYSMCRIKARSRSRSRSRPRSRSRSRSRSRYAFSFLQQAAISKKSCHRVTNRKPTDSSKRHSTEPGAVFLYQRRYKYLFTRTRAQTLASICPALYAEQKSAT